MYWCPSVLSFNTGWIKTWGEQINLFWSKGTKYLLLTRQFCHKCSSNAINHNHDIWRKIYLVSVDMQSFWTPFSFRRHWIRLHVICAVLQKWTSHLGHTDSCVCSGWICMHTSIQLCMVQRWQGQLWRRRQGSVHLPSDSDTCTANGHFYKVTSS